MYAFHRTICTTGWFPWIQSDSHHSFLLSTPFVTHRLPMPFGPYGLDFIHILPHCLRSSSRYSSSSECFLHMGCVRFLDLTRYLTARTDDSYVAPDEFLSSVPFFLFFLSSYWVLLFLILLGMVRFLAYYRIKWHVPPVG